MRTAKFERGWRLLAKWPLPLALLVACAILLATIGASAAAQHRETLNSERIASTFGSYGIEVLAATGETRVSNLYSIESGSRVCRTFAVVRYPHDVAPELAAPHAAILAGGSMGAVLTAAGWTVLKHHLYFGEVVIGATAAALMAVPVGTKIALHAYELSVIKDGRELPYAALVEMHHPDYLSVAELHAIYGDADSAGREQLLATLLATAAERAEGL